LKKNLELVSVPELVKKTPLKLSSVGEKKKVGGMDTIWALVFSEVTVNQ
jgi:hypothetical protein